MNKLVTRREAELQAGERASLLAQLKEAERSRVLLFERVLVRYHAEAVRDLVKGDYAAELGVSEGTLRSKYYKWKNGGLAGLVPKCARRRYVQRESGLPAEFKEWFKGRCESINSDSVPQVRRLMLLELAAGGKIPGFGTWRDLWDAAMGAVPAPESADGKWPRDLAGLEVILPTGLSPRNLLRHKGELMHLTMARQGSFAASALGPMVYTTRVGTRVGQILMFDDVWHNLQCRAMGQLKPVRMIELAALDLCSGYKCAYGMRPRVFNPQTGRNEGVKAHEMLLLLAYQLCEVGYNRDGAILWMERGTAAIDEDMAEMIRALSGGKISHLKAPLKEARQACSMFKSVTGGNSRFKAPIESANNMLHTMLSHLPGQVGRSALVCPEELYGRDKHNELLLKLEMLLPPELAGQLQFGIAHSDEYMQIVGKVYDVMGRMTDHHLEGWEACRHFVKQWLPPGSSEWVALDSLLDGHPEMMVMANSIIAKEPERVRIMPMSRYEVWRRGQSELARLPKQAMPMIMGPNNGVVRQCPDSMDLRFSSRHLGTMPHVYSRVYVDENGFEGRMIPGKSYLFHINPFSPERELFISTPECRYLGCAKRTVVPCRADLDAINAEMGRKRKLAAAEFAQVSGRALTKRAGEVALMQHNAEVVRKAREEGFLQGNGSDNAADVLGDGELGLEADEALLELAGE